MASLPHIVIVGGGAGGLELATHLGNTLGKRQQAKITLVDANLTHIWKPLLHEVAAGTLNSYQDELNYAAHGYQHHFNFCLGKMTGLDRANKEIQLALTLDKRGNTLITERRIAYDKLIIAVGSQCNDFGIASIAEHCYYLDSIKQATKFHQELVNHLIQLDVDIQQGKNENLNIAIIGGGATGVELAAELQHTLDQAKQYGFKALNVSEHVTITIIETAETLLSALPEFIIHAAEKELKHLGIKVYNKQRVIKATAAGLHTADDLFIPAALKVWAAGIKAPEFLTQLDGLETNKINQLLVKSTLQTTQDDNIFAFGDCAYCPQADSEYPVPPRAQAANQQASFLAKHVKKILQQQPLPPFRYHDHGSLVSLGSKFSVGRLMGNLLGHLSISGRLARWTYVSLYKMHQANLHGWWRVFILSVANLVSRRVTPRLKLH